MTIFCSFREFDALLRDLSGKADILRLQAKGGSMFPFIRSGDSVDLLLFRDGRNGVLKGDIILFKKDDHLFLHRVLRRSGEGFIAKGDMSFGSDGMIARENVLAKAVAIQRGEHRVDLGSPANRFAAVLVADVSEISQIFLLVLRKTFGFGASVFSRIQSVRLYRWLGKIILNAPVTVRLAGPEDEEELRDLYLMAGQDVREGIDRIKKTGFWLVAERNRKIVGGITVSRGEKSSGAWIMFGLEVKPCLRGLGIGEKLFVEAVRKAGEAHAVEVGLFVTKKARPALALYRKLGFKVTDEVPPEFNRSAEELYLSKKIHG